MTDINFDSFEPATIEGLNTNPIDFNQPEPNVPEPSNKFEPLNMDMFSGSNNTNNTIDDEEQKRINARKQEFEERQAKINKKVEEEEKLREEIRKKASEYLLEFEKNRQEEIAKRRENLENNRPQNNNDQGGDSWAKVKDNIDLRDSDYKGSKDVQRMREAMLNKKDDPNTPPVTSFFG